jgi:hypothetical protein
MKSKAFFPPCDEPVAFIRVVSLFLNKKRTVLRITNTLLMKLKPHSLNSCLSTRNWVMLEAPQGVRLLLHNPLLVFRSNRRCRLLRHKACSIDQNGFLKVRYP